jgi:hypothetical protein
MKPNATTHSVDNCVVENIPMISMMHVYAKTKIDERKIFDSNLMESINVNCFTIMGISNECYGIPIAINCDVIFTNDNSISGVNVKIAVECAILSDDIS